MTIVIHLLHGRLHSCSREYHVLSVLLINEATTGLCYLGHTWSRALFSIYPAHRHRFNNA